MEGSGDKGYRWSLQRPALPVLSPPVALLPQAWPFLQDSVAQFYLGIAKVVKERIWI